MNFFESFCTQRLRRLYPDTQTEIHRLASSAHWRVSFLVSDRDLAMGKSEPESLARKLNERLTPRDASKRKHWSLLRTK